MDDGEPIWKVSLVFYTIVTAIQDNGGVRIALPGFQGPGCFVIGDIHSETILIEAPYIHRLDLLVLVIVNRVYAPLQPGL